MKKTKPLSINTKRLSLHSIEDKDKQDLIELLTNEIIAKTYMVPVFKNDDEKEKMFEHFKKISNNFQRFLYGIYLNEKLIGFINDVEIIEDEIELGFVIHPTHHNSGYATEVLKKCIEELFNIGYKTIKTGAFEENIASIKVMEKSKMIRLNSTSFIEYKNKIHNCIWFEIKK